MSSFSVESAGLINCPPSMFSNSYPLPQSSACWFDLLQRHARAQPEAIACASRFRRATYRKLWSRIERATARLQGEWGVASGDALAYCGQAHPDALVLYVALARCGALLLPLERPALRSALAELAAALPLKLALLDDEAQPPAAALPTYPLSALISAPCPYQARLATPDPAAPSLLRIGQAGGIERHSLSQLQAVPASGVHEVRDSLFDADVFGPAVLPTLAAGGTLIFL
jgi:hypothetical protein